MRRVFSIGILMFLLAVVMFWRTPTFAQGGHSITISWSPPVSGTATGYAVRRSTAAGIGAVTIGTTVGTVRTYTDTTGVAGTTYFYTVTAVNQFGESVPSNEVSGIFLGDRPGPPQDLHLVSN